MCRRSGRPCAQVPRSRCVRVQGVVPGGGGAAPHVRGARARTSLLPSTGAAPRRPRDASRARGLSRARQSPLPLPLTPCERAAFPLPRRGNPGRARTQLSSVAPAVTSVSDTVTRRAAGRTRRSPTAAAHRRRPLARASRARCPHTRTYKSYRGLHARARARASPLA